MRKLIAILSLLTLSLAITGTMDAKPRNRSIRHIIIAASDTPKEDKKIADYVCDGVNDEAEINAAIESLKFGGTVQLLDGNYHIDSFDNEGNTAIFFGYNDGNARTIDIVGTTQNKAYNSYYGACIHVSDKAIEKMNDNDTYRVFNGAAKKPEGDMFVYTHVNNVNFENLYIYLSHAQKKMIGIDCRNFGNSYLNLVGIYSEDYFHNRFFHLKPAPSVEGCIGIWSSPSSNDEASRLGFDFVNVGGLHTGIVCQGIDHLVMKCCTTARCVIGYRFIGTMCKTLTMINCCDEGNVHLPQFSGTGHLTCIDFNIERFNAAYIPDDPSGDTTHYAKELKPGGWHGFISYTLQGSAFDLKKLWADGSGVNFRTIDLNTSANTWF